MSEKKLRAHALIGPYLFEYGRFSDHEYFSGGPRFALYDDWPLLCPAPYAYKCKAKENFIEITEKDPFILRGLCTKNAVSDFWRKSNNIGLNVEEIKSNNKKIFTKNYIKISKKKLAKLYALVEPSLSRSFSITHSFNAEAEMNSNGASFSESTTRCENYYFGCKNVPSELTGKNVCDCRNIKRVCGCPKTLVIGTCFREDRDIYKSVQVSDDPPENEWVFERTDVYDYCENNVTVNRKAGCKKGPKCPSPNDKNPPEKVCGQAPCGFTYCNICWSYKGENCSRSHSIRLEGNINYDTEEIYSKYSSDIKQLISPTYSNLDRYIFIKYKWDGKNLSETTREDKLSETWTFLSRERRKKARSGTSGGTSIDGIYLYDKKWKFTKIYRRAERYLYGNIHDPLTYRIGGYNFPFHIGGYRAGALNGNLFMTELAAPNTPETLFTSLGADTNYAELRDKCLDPKPQYNINSSITSQNFKTYRLKYTFKNAVRHIPFYNLNFFRGDHFYLKKSKEYVIFYHLFANVQLSLSPTFQDARELQLRPYDCIQKNPKLIGGYDGGGPAKIIWEPVKNKPNKKNFSPQKNCVKKVGCYFDQTAFEKDYSSWTGVIYEFEQNMKKKLPDPKFQWENRVSPDNELANAISTYKRFRTKFRSPTTLSDIEQFPTKTVNVRLNTDIESFQLQFFTPTFSKLRIAPTKNGVVQSNQYILPGGNYNRDGNQLNPINYADDPFWKQKPVGGYVGGYPTPPPFGCINIPKGEYRGDFTNIQINFKTFKPKDFIKNIKWQKSPRE